MKKISPLLVHQGIPVVVRKLRDGRCEASFCETGTCYRAFAETLEEAAAIAARWLTGAQKTRTDECGEQRNAVGT